MVPNGYLLNVTPNEISNYIKNLRVTMQHAARASLCKAMAQDVQKLYDLKFIEGAKYPNHSIMSFSAERLQSSINAVKNGICSDERYDFRSSVILVQDEDNSFFYCLFNSINKDLIKCFEKQPEVSSYKFSILGGTKAVSDEENNRRGKFWNQLFTECGWNKMLMGMNAQLTLQPSISEENISPEELVPYFDSPEKRALKYCRLQVLLNVVKENIGNIPIDKISPYELTEIYMRAEDYLRTSDGNTAKQKILKDVEKGFMKIDPSLIALVDTEFNTQEAK